MLPVVERRVVSQLAIPDGAAYNCGLGVFRAEVASRLGWVVQGEFGQLILTTVKTVTGNVISR